MAQPLKRFLKNFIKDFSAGLSMMYALLSVNFLQLMPSQPV
jgi:hypothetical protein